MSNDNPIINTNSLAFIALCNEFCHALEHADQTERPDFIATMLRQLPRIYIAATDLTVNVFEDEGDPCFIDEALDEEAYEQVRHSVERLMGEDDVYLEVFEENMKYSDTPVAQSIAEGLTDIFQVLYNFVATVRDATDETTGLALLAVRDDFRLYWSMRLCNVLRALNHLAYNL